MNKRDSTDFEKFYDADVRKSSQQRYRATTKPADYSLNDFPGDLVNYEAIDMVEIHMPEDRFRALLEIEEKVKSILNVRTYTDVHPADRVWNDYQEQVRIRNESFAAQNAYEKYLSLLYLSGYRGR